MKKIIRLLCCATIMVVLTSLSPPAKRTQFSIVVLGDMPYNLPGDYARFDTVIQTLNRQNQAFNVFVGDFKSGSTPCSDEAYQTMHGYFDHFDKPLIYTPGDNEWTDCHRAKAGAYDPEERLTKLRALFFNTTQSQGKQKMDLLCESTFPAYKKYTENRRWNHEGITFATIHVVGSNNNYLTDSASSNKEFFERSEANIFWLNDVFRQANADKSPGLVLFIHGDMFTPDKGSSGFAVFLEKLRQLTADYAKPVLLVNGDSHAFKVDKPFYSDPETKKTLLNFTRVQVFGEADMHAVKITIDTTAPSLFKVEELWVPEGK